MKQTHILRNQWRSHLKKQPYSKWGQIRKRFIQDALWPSARRWLCWFFSSAMPGCALGEAESANWGQLPREVQGQEASVRALGREPLQPTSPGDHIHWTGTMETGLSRWLLALISTRPLLWRRLCIALFGWCNLERVTEKKKKKGKHEWRPAYSKFSHWMFYTSLSFGKQNRSISGSVRMVK